jgi:D-alanyl-D-alanine dipeptidase
MKTYQTIPIRECGESLVPIPPEKFLLPSPHPYEKLGANYHGKSPYFLRQGVLNALIFAQNHLQIYQPQWRFLIFDAYRPIEVQQFMVDYTFHTVLQERNLDKEKLTDVQIQAVLAEVYTIWAIPSDNPATPPPHSTGAAIDLTLVDQDGKIVDMGGDIDEMSNRSQPDYYLGSKTALEQGYHQNRVLLAKVMNEAGFSRHKGEWWHFSLGDQMWAWSLGQPRAIYGKIEQKN